MNPASATATGEFSARKDWGYFSPYTNANKYLKLGWDLMAVNAQAETTLDMDFRAPEEIWSPKQTSMGLEGIQINLGIRRSLPSRKAGEMRELKS